MASAAPASANLLRVTALVSATALLGGCSATVVGALTVSQLASIAGVASTLTTGKDLGEHAVSAMTGQDCRFLESLLRKDRAICEDYGSPATDGDFEGVIALVFDEPEKTNGDLIPDLSLASSEEETAPMLRPAYRPGRAYASRRVLARLTQRQVSTEAGAETAPLFPPAQEHWSPEGEWVLGFKGPDQGANAMLASVEAELTTDHPAAHAPRPQIATLAPLPQNDYPHEAAELKYLLGLGPAPLRPVTASAPVAPPAPKVELARAVMPAVTERKVVQTGSDLAPAPIDSIEVQAERREKKRPAPMSFGFMSATFVQTWEYEDYAEGRAPATELSPVSGSEVKIEKPRSWNLPETGDDLRNSPRPATRPGTGAGSNGRGLGFY